MKKTQRYFHSLQSLKFRAGKARIFGGTKQDMKLLIDEHIITGAVVPDWLLEEDVCEECKEIEGKITFGSLKNKKSSLDALGVDYSNER